MCNNFLQQWGKMGSNLMTYMSIIVVVYIYVNKSQVNYSIIYATSNEIHYK